MIHRLLMGSIPPRNATAVHRHGGFEMVLYLSGEGTCHVAEHALPFRAGTVLLIPPGLDHGEKGTRPWRSIWIQFHTQDANPMVSLQQENDLPLTRLARVMLDRYQSLSTDPGAHVRTDPALLSLCEGLVTWVGASRHRLPEAVETYRRSIADHLADPDYRVQDDDACGMTPHHLARMFRAATGVSPRQYLLALRLQAARERLAWGDRKVLDVARACGFRDPFHFSRMFRKQFGVPPRDVVLGPSQRTGRQDHG